MGDDWGEVESVDLTLKLAVGDVGSTVVANRRSPASNQSRSVHHHYRLQWRQTGISKLNSDNSVRKSYTVKKQKFYSLLH